MFTEQSTRLTLLCSSSLLCHLYGYHYTGYHQVTPDCHIAPHQSMTGTLLGPVQGCPRGLVIPSAAPHLHTHTHTSLTLKVVALSVHEDVVHDYDAENAGPQVQVTEYKNKANILEPRGDSKNV